MSFIIYLAIHYEPSKYIKRISLNSIIHLDALAFLLDFSYLQALVLIGVLDMSTSAGTVTCIKMYQSN